MDRFHFITGGLISLLYTTVAGESAEIAIIGPEGGLGLPLVLGGHPFPADAVVQAEGSAWTPRADRLHAELEAGAALQRNLLLFAQALMTQMAHTVVCNRHHTADRQLCRWILLSLDRLQTNELHMIQETIAHMLGVRRAGVNEVARRLREAGLIEHRRGYIRVTDHDALEGDACECYRVIKAEYRCMEQELAGAGDRATPAHGTGVARRLDMR